MKKNMPIPRHLAEQEKYNPTIDLSANVIAYARQSTAKQVVKNVESHRSQTILLLKFIREELSFKDDGTTGTVTLRVENQTVDGEGNIVIKSASGTWPIDRRPGMKVTLDDIEAGSVKLIVSDDVSRLFRDEDRIDSNMFIKACKEHGCYVYIVSMKMLFNFANPSHAETFRMLVQMAASYIQTLKDTTHRRRHQAAERGLWVGFGPISLAFTIEKDKSKPNYGKFIPVERNVKIWKYLYKRIIECDFNLDALVKELSKQDYIFPDFEENVFIGQRGAKKVPGGYTLTTTGLIDGLCNPEHIGIFQRDGNYIENNHPAIIDEETFWLVYDHYRNERPDGTATGRNRVVRFERIETLRPALLKKLLISGDNPEAGFYYKRAEQRVFYYECLFKGCMTRIRTTLASVKAEPLENEILGAMFEHIRQENLKEPKEVIRHQQEERKKRLAGIGKRLVTIIEDRDLIGEEILKEKRKLKKAKLKTSPELQMWERKLAKSIEQEQGLLEEQKMLQDEHKEVGSLTEELGILEEIWPHKSIGLRRALIESIIKCIRVKFCSPRVFKVTIEWASASWGVQEAYLLRERANNHRWSEEEIALLRELHQRHFSKKEREFVKVRGTSGIVFNRMKNSHNSIFSDWLRELWMAFPNRTLTSIRWKLSGLRLTSFDYKGIEANWTYDDIQFLRKLGYDIFSFAHDFSPYNLTGWSRIGA